MSCTAAQSSSDKHRITTRLMANAFLSKLWPRELNGTCVHRVSVRRINRPQRIQSNRFYNVNCRCTSLMQINTCFNAFGLKINFLFLKIRQNESEIKIEQSHLKQRRCTARTRFKINKIILKYI